MILVLTVGTGTAGQHSNLAAGLINSISELQSTPSFVLLVPSNSAESIDLAELVSEECVFDSQVAEENLRIDRPDDLYCAQEKIRQCLSWVSQHYPKEKILVNPTSGTKQMTIGCFLAASEIPGVEICFIGGKRKDGVVVTGTEENLHFEPNRLHRDRALQSAEALYHSGSLEAIFPLLQEFGSSVLPEATLGLCQSHRQSLRFEQARQSATRSDHPALIPLRSYLQEISEKGSNSLLFLAEVFAGAERLRKWGKDTASYLAYYQSVEFGVRTALAIRHDVREPYNLELIANAPHFSDQQKSRFRANARDGQLHLGLHGLHETLIAFGESCGQAYLEKNSSLRSLLNRRNEFIHKGISPDPDLLLALANHSRAHLLDILPEIDLDRPNKLWPNSLSSN